MKLQQLFAMGLIDEISMQTIKDVFRNDGLKKEFRNTPITFEEIEEDIQKFKRYIDTSRDNLHMPVFDLLHQISDAYFVTTTPDELAEIEGSELRKTWYLQELHGKKIHGYGITHISKVSRKKFPQYKDLPEHVWEYLIIGVRRKGTKISPMSFCFIPNNEYIKNINPFKYITATEADKWCEIPACNKRYFKDKKMEELNAEMALSIKNGIIEAVNLMYEATNSFNIVYEYKHSTLFIPMTIENIQQVFKKRDKTDNGRKPVLPTMVKSFEKGGKKCLAQIRMMHNECPISINGYDFGLLYGTDKLHCLAQTRGGQQRLKKGYKKMDRDSYFGFGII